MACSTLPSMQASILEPIAAATGVINHLGTTDQIWTWQQCMNENWCLQHGWVAGNAVSHRYRRDPDTYIRIAIQTYETEVFFLRVSFFNKIFFLKTNEESKKTIFQNFFLVFETISAHFKKSFVKNNCPRTFLLLLLSTEIVDFCFFFVLRSRS